MAYQLTNDQKSILFGTEWASVRTVNNAGGLVGQAVAKGQINSAWRDAYLALYDTITFRTSYTNPETGESTETATPNTSVDPSAWLWIRGAADVNSSIGYFARFIKNYTYIQYESRTGSIIDQSDIIRASNNIAISVFNQIINDDFIIPNIFVIQLEDAGSIARQLFSTENSAPNSSVFPSQGDYAPWSGTLLFPYLGEASFYERLILKDPTVTIRGEATDRIVSPVQKDTYDLISILQTVPQLRPGLFEGIDVAAQIDETKRLNRLKLDATDQLLNTLATKTDAYLNGFYSLKGGEALEVGYRLFPTNILEQAGFKLYGFGINAVVGTLDGGRPKDPLTVGNATRNLVNAGTGDDTVIVEGRIPPPPFGNSDLPRGTSVLDGGEGVNTLRYDTDAYVQHEVKTERLQPGSVPEAPRWRLHVTERSSSAPDSVDLAYRFHKLILGRGDDTAIIDPAMETDVTLIDGGQGNDAIRLFKEPGLVAKFTQSAVEQAMASDQSDVIVADWNNIIFDPSKSLSIANFERFEFATKSSTLTLTQSAGETNTFSLSGSIDGAQFADTTDVFNVADVTEIFMGDKQNFTVGQDTSSVLLAGDGNTLFCSASVDMYALAGSNNIINLIEDRTVSLISLVGANEITNVVNTNYNYVGLNSKSATVDVFGDYNGIYIGVDSIKYKKESIKGKDSFEIGGDFVEVVPSGGEISVNIFGNTNVVDLVSGTCYLTGVGDGHSIAGRSNAGPMFIDLTTNNSSINASSNSTVKIVGSSNRIISYGLTAQVSGSFNLVTAEVYGSLSVSGKQNFVSIRTENQSNALLGGTSSNLNQLGFDNINEGASNKLSNNISQINVAGSDNFVRISGSGLGVISAVGDGHSLSSENGSVDISVYGNDSSLSAGFGDSILTANGFDNYLFGSVGDDTLRILGGGGNTLEGGEGSNVADYSAQLTGVVVNLEVGTANNGYDPVDMLSNINSVLGSNYGCSLIGNASDNLLTGGAGSDVLDGKGGRDRLAGQGGNDAYIFNVGYGYLEITEGDYGYNQTNTLQFGSGIASADVAVAADADGNVILQIAGEDDRVVLRSMFDNVSAGVQKIQFADGAVWDRATVIAKKTSNILTVGAGPDTLLVRVSQDAYKGDAQYTISVDGVQIGGTLTVAALRDNGQSDAVTVLGDFAAGNHQVAVTFLNDEYDGPGLDRNLYLEAATYNGATLPITAANILVSSPASFSFTDQAAQPPAVGSVTVGTGPDKLLLQISQEAYKGDAQYTISVDGAQIGGILTAQAVYGSGQSDLVTVLGDFAAGNHIAAVTFLNDEYDGPGLDRNLYLEAATYNGATLPITLTNVAKSDPATFGFIDQAEPSPAIGSVTVGTGSDKLVLQVSQDAYKGDAQYTVSVDGTQIGGVLTAQAAYGSGQFDLITVLGDFAAGNHTAALAFLNDEYDGPGFDRNLYLDAATYNGVTLPITPTNVAKSDPATFGFTDTFG